MLAAILLTSIQSNLTFSSRPHTSALETLSKFSLGHDHQSHDTHFWSAPSHNFVHDSVK